MSVLRKLILFGGWIPALGGGGATVWYLEQDNIIEDVLKRTGREILWSKNDFQNVYMFFEDDEQFLKDIDGVEKTGWKAVSDWCKEKLSLPITNQNLKEFLGKTQKYCSGKVIVPNEFKEFRNFKRIFNILRSNNNLDLEKMSGSIVHLTDKTKDDVYYKFSNNKDLEKSELTINDKPEDLLERRIFIGKEHRILGLDDKDKEIWNKKLEEYKKEHDLSKTLDFIFQADDLSSVSYEDLKRNCDKLLDKRYTDGWQSSFKLENELFIKFCTVPSTTNPQ